MSKTELALKEVARVLSLEAQSLADLRARLDSPNQTEQWSKTLSILESVLSHGKKIIVTGVGKSGKVADKIAATLASTGSLALYLHPTEGVHGDLGIVAQGDAILALSNSGSTQELMVLLPWLKNRGARIIGILGRPESKMTPFCEAVLNAEVSTEACPHNLAPTTSTTVALAIGDALAVALMQLRGFDAAQFKENHPGGRIGRLLSLQVRDLMKPLSAVAQVVMSAPLRDVAQASTSSGLGAVLVMQGTSLCGIITDGDLRRALLRLEGIENLHAKDVMTSGPITALDTLSAKEALNLMQNRPSQIKELPVVDAQGNCQGLIRLHDLLHAL